MGRFRVGERIGSGGMGTVFRAFDERLQREVAIKEIQTAGADRVLREAQAAARLNHPAIVTLYELGERDGHALLVSELVQGKTLDRVARDGAVSDRDVAEIGKDLCDALATPTSAASSIATSSRRTRSSALSGRRGAARS